MKKQKKGDKLINCECEMKVTKKNLKRHQQAQKHKDLMKNQSPSEHPIPTRSESSEKKTGKSSSKMDEATKKTKKEFRVILNKRFEGKTKEEMADVEVGRRTPTKRKYGDYLYHRGRDLFDKLYADWKGEFESSSSVKEEKEIKLKEVK